MLRDAAILFVLLLVSPLNCAADDPPTAEEVEKRMRAEAPAPRPGAQRDSPGACPRGVGSKHGRQPHRIGGQGHVDDVRRANRAANMDDPSADGDRRQARQ